MRLSQALLVLSLLASQAAYSDFGGFGRNKVRTTKFDWNVLKTEHFEVHYYPGEEEVAHEACINAEEFWRKLVDDFRLIRAPQRRVPIFLFASAADFRQTNIIEGTIDEGIGGFTEVFKTRVVLPLMASAEERRHVLQHELVHAMQYFVLYGEGMRSYTLYKSVMIPLWFVEGMAEYYSNPTDTAGGMVLRDAVLTDRLPSLALMHSFNHLEPHDGYLGYKAGQSAVTFLAATYGDDKPPAILKSVEDARSFDQVFREKTGISLEEFNRRWKNYVKGRFWTQANGKLEAGDYGKPVARTSPHLTAITGAPVPSPVDDTVVFLSDRGGSRNIYIIRKGGSARQLIPADRYERVLSTPPDWSPDGKSIVFVAGRGSKVLLSFVRPENGKVLREIVMPFAEVASPRFSPDGKSLAFSGLDAGTTEIYMMDLATRNWRKLTNDRAAARSPSFSPDGERIYYVADTGTEGGLRVVNNISSGAPSTSPFGDPKQIMGGHPEASPDGSKILYDSDEGGIQNLWVTDASGRDLIQLTDVRTGIYSARWARDGRRILAVTMENGSQNVYLLDDVSAMYRAPRKRNQDSNPAGEKSPRGKAPKGGGKGAVPDVPPSRLSPPGRLFDDSFTKASRSGLLEGIILSTVPARAEEPQPRRSASRQPAEPALPLPVTALLDGSYITLSWKSATMTQAISTYAIYRSTTGNYGMDPHKTMGGGASSYKDSDWRYGVRYHYRIVGLKGSGERVAAGEASLEPVLDVAPTKYKFSFNERLVDLLILVGSVQIGGGTSFAGYGTVQMSDLLGNNRLSLSANAVPGWSDTYQVGYQFSGGRTDFAVVFRAMEWSRFVYVQSAMSTESFRYPPILTSLQNASAMASYPFTAYSRVEIQGGYEGFTEIFTAEDGWEETGRKESALFPLSLALVRDTTRWHRLMPLGGWRGRVEVTQALPLGGDSLDFTEYGTLFESYLGIFDDVSLAGRWWGGVSTGPNRRFYYLGGRYSLRAFPVAKLNGNTAFLGNHEVRVNLASHLNLNLPLLPIMFTDLQGALFLDIAGVSGALEQVSFDTFRPASVGAGLNFVGFIFQSSPIMFSLEVARRIDRDMPNPTIYGRLGPVF